VKSKDAGEVARALPPFAYLYQRLAMDNSRTIRAEAAHILGAASEVLGRSMAPFMRSLVGPWFVAQFDGSTEAASAARGAFMAVFPAASKQRDAYLHFRVEVGFDDIVSAAAVKPFLYVCVYGGP
jgi:E3 ubiquitin-protein ligase listerin